MEGRIAWKGAAGVSLLLLLFLLPFPLVPHVEIEFDDASCSWNFRERELIGNESIRLRTPTFLPSLHICKLKFARLIVHGAFSLLDPSPPPLVPIRNLSETEFSDDRISYSYGRATGRFDREKFSSNRPMVIWMVSMVSICVYVS